MRLKRSEGSNTDAKGGLKPTKMASGSVDLNINTESAEGVIPKLTQDKKRTVNSQVKTATKISVQAQDFTSSFWWLEGEEVWLSRSCA
jgi:hypothetical protein